MNAYFTAIVTFRESSVRRWVGKGKFLSLKFINNFNPYMYTFIKTHSQKNHVISCI